MLFERGEIWKISSQIVRKTVPDCGYGMAEGSFSEGRLNSDNLQRTSAIRSQLAYRGVKLNLFLQYSIAEYYNADFQIAKHLRKPVTKLYNI